ncbi:hypothetical protein MMC32_006484 [Xylographa parallela]|nr:hypothetical protein [Xylographa parallela]
MAPLRATLVTSFVRSLFGWPSPTPAYSPTITHPNATPPYVPNFVAGAALPCTLALTDNWAAIDRAGFMQKNEREIREPTVVACARTLRQTGWKFGAVGFSDRGWAAHRLGAKSIGPRWWSILW